MAECAICNDPFSANGIRCKQMLPCLHDFCSQCVEDILALAKEKQCVAKCIKCHDVFTSDDVHKALPKECAECKAINNQPYEDFIGNDHWWSQITNSFVCDTHITSDCMCSLEPPCMNSFIIETNYQQMDKQYLMFMQNEGNRHYQSKLNKHYANIYSLVKRDTEKLIALTNVGVQGVLKKIHVRRDQLWDKAQSFRASYDKQINDYFDMIEDSMDVMCTIGRKLDLLDVMCNNGATMVNVIRMWLSIKNRVKFSVNMNMMPFVISSDAYAFRYYGNVPLYPDWSNTSWINTFGFVGIIPDVSIECFKELQLQSHGTLVSNEEYTLLINC
jgi:hypothetical protein